MSDALSEWSAGGGTEIGVPDYFGERIEWSTDLLSANPWVGDERLPGETQAVTDVAELRERLASEDVQSQPELVTVRGTLFPCILLFPAYWERVSDPTKGLVAWRNELQQWLFYGFEQWGPSWDVNLPAARETLLGQLGRGDELESILLVLQGDVAGTARRALQEEIAVDVEVTGALIHRSQLPDALAPERPQWGTEFDYGLLASDRDSRHRLVERGKPQTYSAYLWQCWAPTQWITDVDAPRVDETFFVWEHTDVTKPEAVAYNLDSLEHKVAYLRERHGEMVLLQKSSRLVPGEPRFPNERFQEFLQRQEAS